MKCRIAIVLFAMVLFATTFSGVFGAASSTTVYVKAKRVVPLTIKVIFIGPYFSSETVDTSILESLIPENKSNLIIVDEANTEVQYTFNYEFVFATSAFRSEMVQFLKTIQEEKTEENPWFYFYEEEEDWFTTAPIKIKTYVYDAEAVENWLIGNMDKFGGFPDNGYVFIVTDLRELPSVSYNEIKEFLKARTYNQAPPAIEAHYYGKSYSDLDRGYRLKYRDMAVGWGGSQRMWFLDLSAGPSFVSSWYDLPIQVVQEDQNVDPYTHIGGLWLTEFLADYIWEFVYNSAAPNFVYDPQLSEKYRVEVKIFDSRTDEEKEAVPITGTFNPSIVRDAVKRLVPHSEVEVNVQFMNLADYPDLRNLMQASSGFAESWIYKYLFLSSMNLSYVDAAPMYEYLSGNVGRFVQNLTRDEDEYVVPVFAFALSDDTRLTFKYKWLVMKPDLETGAISGVTFNDLILIGLNQKDFLRGNYVDPEQTGKGLGFTQIVTHEVGHALGLMHPHTYGDLGDFVNSAMSYYAYEYNFSVFDVDAISRIHVDKVLMELQKKILEVKEFAVGGNEPSGGIVNFTIHVNTLLAAVDREYSTMNYSSALGIALETRVYVDEVLSGVFEPASSIEQLIADLEAKTSEINRLNVAYNNLQNEYTVLSANYTEMQSNFNELQSRSDSLTEELVRTRFLQYFLIAATVASLATAIIVTRRKM